ncbi:hypothetical protein V8F20_005623 [Naviculisporaceae sp. PSN 640]
MAQPTVSEGGTETMVKTIRQELCAKRVWFPTEDKPDTTCKFFIPKIELNRIMTPERIDLVLKELSADLERPKELSKRITDPAQVPCRQLLAAMIGSEQEHSYPAFVLEGKVDDSCLPIPFPDDEHARDQPSLTCRLGHSHSHDSIAAASPAARNDLSWWSYALATPVLELGAEEISGENNRQPKPKHYVLDRDEVLPIFFPNTGSSGRGSGGKSNVQAAKFAEGHYMYTFHGSWVQEWKNAHSDPSPKFAIKRVVDPKYLRGRSYEHERESMVEYGKHNHKHLMPLLATYEVKGKNEQDPCEYGFVFPRARGSLGGKGGFWESIEKDHERMAHRGFMLKQFHKLAEALNIIHTTTEEAPEELDEGSEDEGSEDEEKNEDDQETGAKVPNRNYHGYITPYSILWFDEETGGIPKVMEPQGRLVLTDFGIPSLEQIHKKQLYQAPECGATGGEVSPASDIFSLGVVFLLFINWYVIGPKPFEEKSGIWNDQIPLFTEHDGSKTGPDSSSLKPIVGETIEELRVFAKKFDGNNDNIVRLLDLVEAKMLQVDIGKRIKCSNLVKELKAIATSHTLTDMSGMQEEIEEIERAMEG